MKLTRLKIFTVVLAIAAAGIGFLFLTNLGLNFQWGIAARHEFTPYKRLLLCISTARKTPGAYHFAAEQFSQFAFEDMLTARRMADRAIELHPNDTIYYYQRGQVNMLCQHYAEARTDFGYALCCWRPKFDVPSQAKLTNAFLRANVYQQAWEKAPPDPVTQSWATYYESTIKQYPDDPFWYWARAHNSMLAGRYADAKTDIESALLRWRPSKSMPSKAELTNGLLVASGYLEASKRIADMQIDGLSNHP